jgi:UrcA family protein
MKTLLSLALLAAAVAAAPAAAQPAGSAAVVVRTADLDLRSPAGISALDRRIHAAVYQACGEASDLDLHGKNLVARCRADTLATVAARRAEAVALARRGTSTEIAAQ